MRKLYIFGLVALAVLIIGLAWAEQITLSTYYPAPYGVYREMNVNYLDFKNDEYDESAADMPADEEARICYDSDTDQFKYSDGSEWFPFGGGNWTLTGTDLYTNDSTQAGINWNVGIGTTQPVERLHVLGSALMGIGSGESEAIRIRGVANYWGSDRDALIIEKTDDDILVEGGMILGFATSTAINTPINSSGWAVNHRPKITIRGTGNVGIGTTSPGYKLHVDSGKIATIGYGNGFFVEHPLASGWIIDANAGGHLSFTNEYTIRLTIENNGNVGIGTTTVPNILTVLQGSATDPIADSWATYPCDRAHKEIIRTINPHGFLDRIIAQPLYEWKRKTEDLDKAKLPKFASTRVGMMVDDKETPQEILLLDAEGKVEGIDLLAYIGYLHATIKEAALEIQNLKVEVDELKGNL